MAKDYLAIPGKYIIKKLFKYISIYILNYTNIYIFIATSVPVERIFSSGTNLISAKRCSLNVETIQACMCLKSWTKFQLDKK